MTIAVRTGAKAVGRSIGSFAVYLSCEPQGATYDKVDYVPFLDLFTST